MLKSAFYVCVYVWSEGERQIVKGTFLLGILLGKLSISRHSNWEISRVIKYFLLSKSILAEKHTLSDTFKGENVTPWIITKQKGILSTFCCISTKLHFSLPSLRFNEHKSLRYCGKMLMQFAVCCNNYVAITKIKEIPHVFADFMWEKTR